MRRLLLFVSLIVIYSPEIFAAGFLLQPEASREQIGPFSGESGSEIKLGNEVLKVTNVSSDGRFSLKSLRSGRIFGPFSNKHGSKLHLGAYRFTVVEVKDIGENNKAKDTIDSYAKKKKMTTVKPNVFDALKVNDISTVAEMLASDPSVVDLRNNGMTPLFYAAYHGGIEAVRLLVERGADVNALNEQHRLRGCKETPLFTACTAYVHNVARLKNDYPNVPPRTDAIFETIRFFLDKGVDPNPFCRDGITPLSLASQYGCIELVEVLLKYGAKVQLHSNIETSALVDAITRKHSDVVKVLLETEKADLNLKNYRGWTLMHYAASFGNEEIMDMLLGAGVSPNLSSESGTPLELAITKGNSLALINSFQKHGVEFNKTPPEDSSTLDLIRWSLAMGDIDKAKHLIEANPDLLNEPRKNDATIVETAIAQTALSEEQKRNLMDWFIEHGLELKRPKLLYEQFKQEGHYPELFVYLVESGAEVNTSSVSFCPITRGKSHREAMVNWGRDSTDLDQTIKYLRSKISKRRF